MAKSAGKTTKPSAKPKPVKAKAQAARAEPTAGGAFDVLIVGVHPAAHFAAAMLAHDAPKLKILHVRLPGEEHADRLQLVNPKLLSLHPILKKAEALSSLPTSRGLQFLSDTPGLKGEFVTAKPAAFVAPTATLTDAMSELAGEQGGTIEFASGAKFSVVRVLDDGVQVVLDERQITARVLIVATDLPAESARVLGISPEREPGVMHRYSFIKVSPSRGAVTAPANGAVPMSLDLAGCGAWAWLLSGEGEVQLSVQQPERSCRAYAPDRLMKIWVDQLAGHGIVKAPEKLLAGAAIHVADIPVAGALSGETVANRTLLIGPAGGFYSACGEDVYPACWSAAAAVEVAIKALRASHVQDELQSYRQKWGSTLGDYLRGPQQNLTLLLPLIYKNPVMSARVAEAILWGESVVR